MGDLRMGLFHQMEGTIRGHLAEASRPASRGDRFEEQKQAMINLGVPEAVAEDRAKALILFAEGDADYVTDDVIADIAAEILGINDGADSTQANVVSIVAERLRRRRR